MKCSNFVTLIKSDTLQISLQGISYFSFATSPYHAHQHGVALDIYQDLSLKNFTAFSPVTGEVIDTRILKAPTPGFEGGISNEYVILIKNTKDPEIIYKILHVKPKVKKGTFVNTGDELGTTIKNGYFAPWSSPHIHLEIRRKENPFRARGGVEIPLNLSHLSFKLHEKEENNHNYTPLPIPVKIESIYSQYYLAKASTRFYTQFSGIFGLSGHLKEDKCILDGGFPIYEKGIALFNRKFDNEYLHSPIYLGTKEVGHINGGYNNFYFYKFKNLPLYLDNKRLRGISLFLAFRYPLIKLIPANPTETTLNQKSTFKLMINPNE
ncbi:MAG: hypothetical protein R6U96_01585 [Promethearchaeia archaeon]